MIRKVANGLTVRNNFKNNIWAAGAAIREPIVIYIYGYPAKRSRFVIYTAVSIGSCTITKFST